MAEPVVGHYRFREAVPIRPWKGVKDAFNYVSCPQPAYKMRDNTTKRTEDCLLVNVFTSRKCLDKGNCSVIAFVHGGLRWFISPEKSPEEVIINTFANDERGIVFVALQYRLGIFGWLHLAPSLLTTADSNLANRDVLFGLKWIQKEIGSFGGDPGRVSFMGHSSGAAQVVELVLSGVADDLYSQVILMSSPFWGEKNNASNLLWSRRMAEKAGCVGEGETWTTVQNVTAIEACLRSKTTKELFDVQQSMEAEIPMLEGVWIDGPGGLFPGSFESLFKRRLPQGKKFLLGTTSAEDMDTRVIVDEEGNINMTRLDPLCTALGYEFNYEKPEGFRKACIAEYKPLDRVSSLNDDLVYYQHSGMLADKFSRDGVCYVYSFEYPVLGERFVWNATVVTPRHTEDLTYIMWGKYDEFTDRDLEMERKYSGIFANFARTGDPTFEGQEWKPWTPENREFFAIDFDENITMPGLKTGYHGGMATYFERILPATAGKARPPPMDLPPSADLFLFHIVIQALKSEWANESKFNAKDYDVAMEQVQIWKRHVVHLQKMKIHERTGFDWLNFILAVIVIALVVSIMVVLYRHWKRRREYQSM